MRDLSRRKTEKENVKKKSRATLLAKIVPKNHLANEGFQKGWERHVVPRREMILLELVCPGLIEVAVKSHFHKRSSPLQLSLLEMASSER